MIKSNRISTICSLVDKKIIAEIGADHGYITLNLFQNAKIDFAFLTDISDNSLQKARDNFSQSNLSNNVMFLVGDGLKVFENIQKENNCKKPEQIIIAGMGGNEIIKILQNNKYSFENFILQPQRNVIELRHYLQENFFEIKKDIITKDGKLFYNVLKVEKVKTKKLLNNKELLFGKTNLQTKNPVFRDYLVYELDKLQGYSKHTKEVESKIIQIKEVLKEI